MKAIEKEEKEVVGHPEKKEELAKKKKILEIKKIEEEEDEPVEHAPKVINKKELPSILKEAKVS